MLLNASFFGNLDSEEQLGHAIGKRMFWHFRTAKPQISLRIPTVWSGISLSANRITGCSKLCINGEQMPEFDLAHAQDDVNPHILRMLGQCFA